MQHQKRYVIDPAPANAEQIAAFRQAAEECYCGLGPACPLWQQMSPEQRTDCSLDKRATAQRLWRTGT
jgi:hypothetical protein